MTAKHPYDNFFRPASIAIVGASPHRGSSRNSLLRVVVKHGFDGRIYPVSPNHKEIEGLAVSPSITALPQVPDLALVITPAPSVAHVIEECAHKGIRNAIVYSSGFEEIESGRPHARNLLAASRTHGVAVIGANCQGIWSVRHRAILTFGAASLSLETVQHAPIAIISQSGALAGAIANVLQTNGMGCAYVVSVGNETCLDALDALSWVIEQDDVRVVALYIEGLSEARRILPLAQRARSHGIQIVCLKAGRSSIGQEATASHTGKIASEHAIYRDALEQAGVISVDTIADALIALEALTYLAAPRTCTDTGGGVSVMGSSGGAGALLADHSAELGIPMARFRAETAARLDTILPEFARKENPVDLTGQINSDPNLFKNTCLALRDDPATEAIVVQFASSGRRGVRDNAEVFRTVARELPFVVSLVGEVLETEFRKELRHAGIYASTDPALTMRALSFLYQRSRRMRAQLPSQVAASVRSAPRDWADTMRYCEAAGLTPARWTILLPDDRAENACATLAYPLAAKVLPSASDHKTELGLVALNLQSAAEVDAHAERFRARLQQPDAGILVQEMAGEGVEAVMSCMRNTDFGPVITLGSGGVGIELYRDVAHLVLPVSADEVRAALAKLKLARLLAGFRGRPAADLDALVAAAVRFGDLFMGCPEVVEFELNPVIVRPRGQGVVAVDALVKTHDRTDRSAHP